MREPDVIGVDRGRAGRTGRQPVRERLVVQPYAHDEFGVTTSLLSGVNGSE